MRAPEHIKSKQLYRAIRCSQLMLEAKRQYELALKEFNEHWEKMSSTERDQYFIEAADYVDDVQIPFAARRAEGEK